VRDASIVQEPNDARESPPPPILVDVIHGPAGKLRSVHNIYQRTEEDTHALYDQMKDALKDG